MQSGKRITRVRIEKLVTNKNATSGASVKSWVLFKPVWVSIRTISVYEKQAADAAWPGADCEISFKFINGVLPTMRIVDGSVIYSILGITDVEERHRDLKILCQRGTKAS